jgi:2-oxoglutarate ferredoxin oxidoreductase subunit alpha
VIGFGTAGRVASSAVKIAREEGIKVGLFRPITLAPFPKERIREISKQVKRILVVEMNTGMMLDDITAITKEDVPVEFYGRLGGMTPLPDEILDEIHRIVENKAKVVHPRQEWSQRLEKLINGGK